MSDNAGAFRSDGFGRKLGPLPLWGWALILVAGVYIYYHFFSGSGNVATPAVGGATTGNTQTSSPMGMPSFGAPAAPSFSDNQSWQNAAISEASQFNASPLDVQNATTDYLGGSNLTPSQGALINRILGGLGAAPLGTSGVSAVVSPPAPTPQTVAPSVKQGYPLPTGRNDTLVWIKGLAGVRRGGLYSVTGNRASFVASAHSVPVGVPVVTNNAQIAQLETRVRGLK